MYKKVYVEITNNCNLNCDFCAKNTRPSKFMSIDDFKYILSVLQGYTKYLYFHVLGEPLLHPNILEFISLANENYNVNITTNGFLIKRLKNVSGIRQINISLHSFNNKYGIPLEKYMNNIFETVDTLPNTYVSYRLWTKSDSTKEIIDMINKKYNQNIDYNNIENKNITLKENVFLSKSEEFIWPNLDNDYYNEVGTCYGLSKHIGILSNGNVVPCCLDSKGIISLGNIFKTPLKDIIESSRYQNIINGFKNNYKCEELCRHCNFISK